MNIDRIIPALKGRSKRQVLEELARAAAALTGADAEAILSALMERERLGTTGVGQGVALPHARIPGLERLYAIFARAAEPVPFDAVDDKPVDLFIMLLAPGEASAEHLRALAQAARLLRNRELCRQLRGADGEEAIAALLNPRLAA
ncbi:MAG: PTS IIA-like nitrogen-regulatory protein PtsN [Rhodothalassiaceae bacterium]|nr:MAG: PTS IIA-like nitrogen-regulatory protein PtsN [Rhodothalassiaceae bacterium]